MAINSLDYPELSPSQAAKLFHLSPQEIRTLDRARQALLSSASVIHSKLCSRLSLLPGCAELLDSDGRRSRPGRGVTRWLDLALRPWSPATRQPKLKHLATFCCRIGVPAGYIAAIFSCLHEVCADILSEAATAGKLPDESAANVIRIVNKRLATEQLGLLAVYSKHSCRIHELHMEQMQQKIQGRSDLLASTVALSQAISQEIEESQVISVLAHHVMDTFSPDCLMIHTVESGDLLETPVTIINGKVVRLPEDDRTQALRSDWRLCRAARTGNLFHVPDVTSALVRCTVQIREQTSGSYCCVPLASSTEVFGCMHLRRLRAGAFSEEDLEILSVYGRLVGAALTSLRLLKLNRQQADTDPLTGLHNRRYFHAMLEKEEMLLNRRGGSACVLMIDVDQFKQVNDQHGHEPGDRLLQELANVLRNTVRRTDEIARYGGDEFVVMLRDCKPADALRLASNITEKVLETQILAEGGHEVGATVSVGVAGSPAHARGLEETILLADAAMLRAKKAGGNQAAVFQTSPASAVAGE